MPLTSLHSHLPPPAQSHICHHMPHPLLQVRELEATNDKSGSSTGDFGGQASAGSDAVPAEQIVALAQALDDSREKYFFWQ